MSSSDGPRAQTEETGLATAKSDEGVVAEFQGLGSTDIGANDIEMPRLKLLQGLSDPVANQKAPQGTYWNSLTDEPYGDGILIVPVVGFKNRVRLQVGKGLVCRSFDMEQGIGDPGIKCIECPLKDWPDERRRRGDANVDPKLAGPECRVSHNWLVLVVGSTGLDGKPGERQMVAFDEPHWAVLAWTGTATKAAKKLNGLRVQQMTMRPGSRWSDRIYKVGAENVRGEKGNYFLPTIGLHGPSTEDQRQAAIALADFMKGKQVTYEYATDEVPEEAAAPASAATATDSKIDY